MSETLQFKGWWSEDEKTDCPEPWETFTIILHGNETGDFVTGEYGHTVESVLKASGYRLTLERIPATTKAKRRGRSETGA